MTGSPEMLPRIEAIFTEALALPEGDRQRFIEIHCKGDTDLAAEVRSLLKACAAEELLASVRLRESRIETFADGRNKRVGAYEIDRLIGRGGMGAVYVAHRADGNFEQQVAVKLIDLPLATDLFRERFRLERQILAGLSHPLIARLLDGGVTSEGEPFLVMEYVDGVPIHRYCENNLLSVSRRLMLFKSVCEAVQFAHQNLVVHRDLKPDNILVSDDGTPRLLDFGTAKLLSPSAEGLGSEFTRQGFQSFTPQYASPEQVLGNPITTASDTYSLGVLLYLLLTGALPYELKEFTTAEMVSVICEQPPRRPVLPDGAGKRLDADLEAIVLKALRKGPEERYLTAVQLAGDVQAYLDGRTVTARRGTFRYRANKFIRRNRIAVLAAGLVISTLIAGVGGVLWQAKLANAERHKAEARAADLRQLSNSLLSELDEAIKELPGSTGVQRLLVTRVLEHLDRMSGDAAGDRLIQLDLVNAYTRLGNIQGNPYDQNLGDPAGALVSLDKALAFASSLTASAALDREALHAMASVEQARSEVLWGVEKTPEAVASMQSATQAYERLVAEREADPALFCQAAAAYGTLGDELGQPGTPSLGDPVGALVAYRKDIQLYEHALGMDPNLPCARRGLGIIQIKVGNIEIETNPAQALKDFELAQQRFEALPDSKQSGLSSQRMRANLLRKKAMAMRELGEYSQAVPLFEEALTIQKQIAAADPKDTRSLFDVYVDLSQAAYDFEESADPAFTTDPLMRRRKFALAAPLLKQAESIALQLSRENPSNDDWKTYLADAQVRLGIVEQHLNASADSSTFAATGLATLKELAAKHPNSILILDSEVAALLNARPLALRDTSLAIACAEREALLTKRKKPNVLLSVAQAYRFAGQMELARAAANEGLALIPAASAGVPLPRTRKLLELEAQVAR
ncbi:MAG TPA: serine/threonine-protein kinase [Candidatus Saccharimonadales bacterium]|nr:serine/threonine-protein kinase [Candidatus Saccharimonadales bacterium]